MFSCGCFFVFWLSVWFGLLSFGLAFGLVRLGWLLLRSGSSFSVYIGFSFQVEVIE